MFIDPRGPLLSGIRQEGARECSEGDHRGWNTESRVVGYTTSPEVPPAAIRLMKRRPILDESSFEKLLTAAWVLQCERDRALAESNSESEISGLARKGPVGTGVPASFAPTETKAALPAIAAGAPSKLQIGGQIILPPTPSPLPT